MDLLDRLKEPIIADAFERHEINSGALADRLIRERGEAVQEIERLRAALEELRVLGEQGSPPDYTRWLAFHDRVVEIATRGLNGQGRKSDGIS